MKEVFLRVRLSLFSIACLLVPYIMPFSALHKRGFSVGEHDKYFKKLENDCHINHKLQTAVSAASKVENLGKPGKTHYAPK